MSPGSPFLALPKRSSRDRDGVTYLGDEGSLGGGAHCVSLLEESIRSRSRDACAIAIKVSYLPACLHSNPGIFEGCYTEMLFPNIVRMLY